MAKGWIEIDKNDIKEIKDNSVVVNYRGEAWEIKYGKFVKKEDVEKANRLIIRKFGNEWLLANVDNAKKKEVKKANGENILMQIRATFIEKLSTKASWGHNEIIRAFDESCIEILGKKVHFNE